MKTLIFSLLEWLSSIFYDEDVDIQVGAFLRISGEPGVVTCMGPEAFAFRSIKTLDERVVSYDADEPIVWIDEIDARFTVVESDHPESALELYNQWVS